LATGEFESILSCIDRGLGVYGKSVTSVVYWSFREKYLMSREDIVERPELFKSLLQNMFGAGGKCIERAIVREIKEMFRLDLVNFFDIPEAIRKAKEHLVITQRQNLVLDVINRAK
jgi:hypothetical protein